MKIPKIIWALEFIDDEYIAEAAEYRRTKNTGSWFKYGALAACVVLVVAAAAFAVRESRIPVRPDPDATTVPIVTEPTWATTPDTESNVTASTGTTASDSTAIVSNEITNGTEAEVSDDIPKMGGSDFTFSRKFVDEVYNIYIVDQIVGQEACDEWVNNVYLKQTREEMSALPDLYQAIVGLNVSREEFEKENNKYIDYPGMYYTEDVIDALYMDDVEEMKRLLTNPFALYYGGEIYTFDAMSQNPQIAADIPHGVLNEYLDFIESVCEQEGLIKYMQEDIDGVRKASKAG